MNKKSGKDSKIVITMKNFDHARIFRARLVDFCRMAEQGGDAELYIKIGGRLRGCGKIATDLKVDDIVHVTLEEVEEVLPKKQLCRIEDGPFEKRISGELYTEI